MPRYRIPVNRVQFWNLYVDAQDKAGAKLALKEILEEIGEAVEQLEDSELDGEEIQVAGEPEEVD